MVSLANYQGFNSSIGSYRNVVQNVSSSQANISNVKELLVKARADLATRRPALKDQRTSSLKYKQMIEILGQIEELKLIPEKLESQISQKKFLQAHETLSSGLKMADNEDLAAISALQPIQSYLATQESSLFSILIEELHNHLYLKSPYCDNRWHSYRHESDEFSTAEQILEEKINFELSDKSYASSGSSLLDEFLNSLTSKISETSEELRKNIEANSFEYIQMIIETLARLNRLPSAFDVIHQRVPTELHKIVDKTISDINSRLPRALRDAPDAHAPQDLLDYSVLGTNSRSSALKDFIWTLYSKFIAVLQGHRVIYEVIQSISATQGGDNSDNALLDYDFFNVFKIFESEIRSLLISYISDKDHRGVSSPVELNGGAKKFSLLSTRRSRNKKKALFKFSGVDFQTNEEFQSQYQTLQNTLDESVPGLASAAYEDSQAPQKMTPFAPTNLSSSHQLLTSPNVLNIRVLLDPTLTFVQKAKAVFPYHEKGTEKETDRFLEDFLINVFLPQLEDSLSRSFNNIMMKSDAFDLDSQWNQLSKRPIYNAASSFIELVNKTCRLLNTGYLYREKYAFLIISAIKWLAKLFKEHFENLVSINGDEATSKGKIIGYSLAMNEAMRSLWEAQLRTYANYNQDNDNIMNELNMFLGKRYSQKGSDACIRYQDLLDINAYHSLSLLVTSLKWVIFKLNEIRKVGNEEVKDGMGNMDTKLRNVGHYRR